MRGLTQVEFLRESLEEKSRQDRHILGALPQGRAVDRKHAQAVVQVCPELAGLGLGKQVLVGGGDHAHVHFPRLVFAHALERPFLQHAQQLALQVVGDLADFIQKERATVGQLEASAAVLERHP